MIVHVTVEKPHPRIDSLQHRGRAALGEDVEDVLRVFPAVLVQHGLAVEMNRVHVLGGAEPEEVPRHPFTHGHRQAGDRLVYVPVDGVHHVALAKHRVSWIGLVSYRRVRVDVFFDIQTLVFVEYGKQDHEFFIDVFPVTVVVENTFPANNDRSHEPGVEVPYLVMRRVIERRDAWWVVRPWARRHVPSVDGERFWRDSVIGVVRVEGALVRLIRLDDVRVHGVGPRRQIFKHDLDFISNFRFHGWTHNS